MLLRFSGLRAPPCHTLPVGTIVRCMRDSNGKTINKANLPSKTCAVCNRPFTWRKKWESCWEDVKFCSDRCRRTSKAGIPKAVSTNAEQGSASAEAAEELHSNGSSGHAARGSALSMHELQAGDEAGRAQDLGNIVHFEHLNLEVQDLEKARIFYTEGLGLAMDPGANFRQRGSVFVNFFNCGRQQLHISRSTRSQRTPLPVTLVMPDSGLAALEERLSFVKKHLEGTQFCWERMSDSSILVTDPEGQQYTVQDAAAVGHSWPFDLAIKEIRLPAHAGSSEAIAHWYRTLFGARAEAHDGTATVFMGPGTTLIFDEAAGQHLGEVGSGGAAHEWQGWHIAFYISQFSGSFNAVQAAGLNQTKHKYLDKSPDLKSALHFNQFRVTDLVAVSGDSDGTGQLQNGELLHRFGHEVRSMYHPRFMRPLYNSIGNASSLTDHGPPQF